MYQIKMNNGIKMFSIVDLFELSKPECLPKGIVKLLMTNGQAITTGSDLGSYLQIENY